MEAMDEIFSYLDEDMKLLIFTTIQKLYYLSDEGDYRAWYMGHCGIVPEITRTELREIIRRLLENLSIVEMEGTSPKYVLGETQVYLGPPLSLQFTKID